MDTFLQTIHSGSTTVLSAGTVISFNDEPVQFVLGHATHERPMTLTMHFTTDKKKKSYLKAETVTEHELELHLVNFNAALDVGNTEPIEIGNYNDKQLYFSFRIRSLNNSQQRTINYTFYHHA